MQLCGPREGQLGLQAVVGGYPAPLSVGGAGGPGKCRGRCSLWKGLVDGGRRSGAALQVWPGALPVLAGEAGPGEWSV